MTVSDGFRLSALTGSQRLVAFENAMDVRRMSGATSWGAPRPAMDFAEILTEPNVRAKCSYCLESLPHPNAKAISGPLGA
jgi:hypothetical protein